MNMSSRLVIALGIAGCVITAGCDLSAGRMIGFGACISGMLLQRMDYSGKFFPDMQPLNVFVVALIAMLVCAAFGPVILCSLFWKRCNLAGALSGMIAGGVVVFIWKYCVRPLGGAFDIYELLPAFLVSCVVIVIVSLLTKAPEEDIVKEFDAANAK